MPAQKQVSGILSKLGGRLREAINAHKGDETERGQVELPEGIRGGIAQVSMAKFDVFKTGDSKGEPYFMASAVVIHPKEHVDGKGRKHRTEGQHTRIGPEPICETPKRSRKTLNEHIAWVLNILRICGVNTAEFPDDGDLGEHMEAAVASLVDPENPVYIKFDTFTMPNEDGSTPRINHKWIDSADPSEVETSDPADAVEETPAAKKPSTNGVAQPPKKTGPVQTTPAPKVSTKPTVTSKPTAKVPPKKAPEPEPEEEEAEEPGYVDDGDLDALAVKADAKKPDKAAQDQIAEAAVAMGFTDEQVAEAESWTALVEQMKAGTPEPDEEAEEEEETEAEPEEEEEASQEWSPNAEEVYMYKPLDPKTKKRATKAIEVVVVTVNMKLKTVDLKNNDNPKVKYLKVAWDQLESGE